MWIAALVLATGARGQQSSLIYLRADPDIVLRRLTPVPATQHDRVEKLRKQLHAAKVYGPIEVTEQNIPGEAEPNLICSLPGTRSSTILVAVNMADNATGDEGQVNWATLEMLPLLVESLAASSSHNTLQFIAFNGSKGTHSGIAFYLNHMNKPDRKKIEAAIELDHLGRTSAAYAPRSNGYGLGKRLRLTAWTMKYYLPQVYLDQSNANVLGGGPIARTFENASIRAITIYSRDHSDLLELNLDGPPTYIQKLDVDPNAYYETYLLLCAYLREIDRDFNR